MKRWKIIRYATAAFLIMCGVTLAIAILSGSGPQADTARNTMTLPEYLTSGDWTWFWGGWIALYAVVIGFALTCPAFDD